MPKLATKYATQILHEIEDTPEQCLPHVLEILKAFNKATALTSAEKSFRQAWK